MSDVNSRIIDIMKQENATFLVSLPCKLLDTFIRMCDSDNDVDHVIVAREEEGIGICSGAYLAGRTPVMAIQSTGLGTIFNELASLPIYFEIPMFILVSYRGTEAEKVAAQNVLGKSIPGLLDAMSIDYQILDNANQTDEIRTLLKKAKQKSKPVVALLLPSFWKEESE